MLPPPGYDAGFTAGVAVGVAQERERLRRQVGTRLPTVMEQRRLTIVADLQKEHEKRFEDMQAMVDVQAQQLFRLTQEVQQLRRTTRSRSPSRGR